MKRLLLSAALIITGTVVFAQAPSKAKAAPAPATMQTATPVAQEAVTHGDATATTTNKKSDKKECSPADKKECGSKSGGKKSCCSHSEATKEETK
jgi:hypothetical protein